MKLAGIDQAQIHDIDRYFRVIAGFQLRPNQPFDIFLAGAVGQAGWWHRLFANGVGVLASDAKQVAIDEHGKTAPQGLRYVSDGPGGQSHFIPGRDHPMRQIKEYCGIFGVFNAEDDYGQLRFECCLLVFFSECIAARFEKDRCSIRIFA